MNTIIEGIKQMLKPIQLTRTIILTAMLLLGGMTAKATDYVFMYNGGYLAVSGENIIYTTTFSPQCVWTCVSNSTDLTPASLQNSNTLYWLTTIDGNGTRRWLQASNSNGANITTSTTAGTAYWRRDNSSRLIYRRSNNSYYAYYRGNQWRVSNTAGYDNSNNSYYGPNPYPDYRALYTTVDTNPTPSTSTAPVITSGADVLSLTGSSNYIASAAVYQIGYTNYYFSSTNHYFDVNGNSITGTPSAASISYSWSLTPDNDYASVSGTTTTGVVYVATLPQIDLTLTLTITATATGGNPEAPANTTLSDSKTITIQGTKPSAPIITVSGTTVTISTNAIGTTSIRYTLDGTEPTASNGTVYSGPIDLSSSTTSPVTVKAVTVRNGNASDVSTEVVTLTLPEPVITADGSAGTATITCDISGATIYYTLNGSEPTTSSTPYTGSLSGLSPMTTIKAIAVKSGWNDSPVASETLTIPSGVSGGTVTLFDYEDHNWSYYQASSNLPTGYPTEYLSSPDPRNVKITYRGVNENGKPCTSNGNAINNASDVAISALDGEGQNTMVYYKTLEKSVPGMTGDYPYTVISNPFSKRPATTSGNTKTYYGFAGWKVISGGEYISEYADNATLPLDATIHFTNLNTNYTPNCTSAEVVFEATWTEATVKTGNSAQTFTGGTYETNFWVLNANPTGAVTVPGNCTMTARYPDGTNNWTGNFTRAITAGGNNAKVEWVNMNSTNAVSAANYTFTMGRGIVNSGNGGELNLTTRDANSEHTVKIESGKYSQLRNFTTSLTAARTCDQLMTLGCDYDRAKDDNTKLTITGSMYVAGTTLNLNRSSNSLYVRGIIKSGDFLSGVAIDNNYTGAGGTQTYYFSVGNSSTQNAGRRYLVVEGGILKGIAGGMDESNNQSVTDRAFDLRVRGSAQIDGVIYGAAEFANAKGVRTMIFTGGTINGWIAGGANGTQNTNGALTGATYVYVGGNTKLDSEGSTRVLNRAVGGNVFGAGCGFSATSSSGQILTYNTNVVVADESYIERGVYGGGSYGYTTNTSNIYILGGTVDGKNGGVNGTTYQASITGGVFGGACQNQGGTVNIYMDGGLVNGGVYGGSNATGTISNNVTMQIDGGQVGADAEHTANIHGGGYGQDTRVSHNVDITLGSSCTATEGVTVYGDVYGGSALGLVNGTTATNTYHTYVTLNKGTIYGSLYGGGLGNAGNAANVYGPVQVKVYGGSVKKTDANGANGSGAVYGCNNLNGAPQRAVSVDIYGTDPAPSENEYALFAVYGGGNQANYSYGTPTVTVHNCDNSIEYVYGGGNAAHITNGNTDVKIYGGNKIGTVFGGGNGTVTAANVSGNTNVKIYGGTILRVFGGSNTNGTIGGTISVTAETQTEAGNDPCSGNAFQRCPIQVDELYGGGNMAPSNAGNITIGCMEDGDIINYVYGGSNDADITGNINLTMAGGRVGNLFGGNNTGHSISGSITVNVNWDGSCSNNYLGNVYGGGNLATFGTTESPKAPTVNILNGTVSGNVYGGGKGDPADHTKGQVTGNPVVTIGDNTAGHESYVAAVTGDVYGGGDAGNVVGTPQVNVVNKCNTTIGNVYGGGNAADVNGTDVNIDGGNITGMVFGGGHGNNDPSDLKVANVNGNVDVDITGGTINKVFAGSNLNGTISGAITLDINKSTASGACDMIIREVYGGGNEAAGNAGTITVGCTGTLTTQASDPNNIGVTLEGIGAVYGGANQADIGASGTGNESNITLNINSGMVGNVYGGNNTSGTIYGTIIVNVEKNNAATCADDWYVGNVYGGGNLATYNSPNDGEGHPTYPRVNILNGTVSGNVYGGGKGDPADHSKGQVTGNPVVTIGDNTAGHESYVAAVTGDVYGGGDAGNVVGTPQVNVVNKCNTTIGNVYGGGNAADVNGTAVNIDGGTITGDVFGGGHGDKDAVPALQADVNGNTSVTVTGGTINRVFGGSNSKGDISGTISVVINKGANSCAMHITEVYGGGNFAASNVGNITIGCMDATDIVEYVYGGANQADITGDINLTMTGGRVGNLFGGNNTSGTISGSITVNVEKDDALPCASNWYLGNVFGGGNLATFGTTESPKAPTVNIKHGTVSGNVYGGGKGDPADHSKGQVTGNPVVTIGDNVNTHQVTVSGSVFGGGDAGNVVGTPAVNVIEKCNTVITTAVYGGGNAAHVSATNVTIDGGTIGDVFGGGNGAVAAADVTGATSLVIHGGTITRVFAGGNTSGTIGTNSGVTINKTSSCAMKIAEVYGGGNFAPGNAGTINIGCTGTKVDLASGQHYGIDQEGIGTVYGGANQANISNNITLNINSGIVENVFGGNNTSGSISGTITVNVEKNNVATCADNWYVGNVYGGGNLAPYTGSPAVNIKNGTVSQNVYGGGKGLTAVVTGNPLVTVGDNTNANYSAIVLGDVYGGGDAAAVTGSTSVTYNDTNATSTVAKLFGGGNAAGVTGTATVALTQGTVTTGVYGGCNSSGNVGGKITVNVTGGTLGSQTNLNSYTTADVFGGGFGASTSTSGNVEVNINGSGVNIFGDVYGGSALGNVNTNGTNTTTVNIFNGTLHSVTDNSTGFPVYIGGNVYGGGLGRKADSEHSAVEAKVFGAVTVNIGSGEPSSTETGEHFTGNATIGGNVYGGNNTNGSPQDNITVNVYRTAHIEGVNTVDDNGFAIANVFGGGNEADYTATGKMATVNIFGCYNTIERTFGGGNAAETPTVTTNIQGGHIDKVFGGGNGERGSYFGADVNGDVYLNIHGGHIGQSFGGSNQNGTISGQIHIVADNDGPCGGSTLIDEFFCGGNFADITHDLTTDILCSEGMVVRDLYGGCNQANITGNVVLNVYGGEFTNVFGGSKGDLASIGTGHTDKEARITGNVTLNLYGGTMENVYGGSNVNGNITGTIIVNVIDIEEECPLYITNIYGGSNLTSYTPTYDPAPGTERITPIVNVVHAKSGISGNVYGGSKGAEGATTLVNSNPRVNIGYNSDMNGNIPASYLSGYASLLTSPRAIVAGSVFGGGDAATVNGNTAIFLRNRAKVFGNVYGGGNMGVVTGDTKVIVNGENQ